jgi:hypothetical protein
MLTCLERPCGLIKRMCKQCVPGSFSPPEPGYEAGGGGGGRGAKWPSGIPGGGKLTCQTIQQLTSGSSSKWC